MSHVDPAADCIPHVDSVIGLVVATVDQEVDPAPMRTTARISRRVDEPPNWLASAAGAAARSTACAMAEAVVAESAAMDAASLARFIRKFSSCSSATVLTMPANNRKSLT